MRTHPDDVVSPVATRQWPPQLTGNKVIKGARQHCTSTENVMKKKRTDATKGCDILTYAL